jgi:DNA-nicking Smr family endonuclease
MDFGDILRQWESGANAHAVIDKDKIAMDAAAQEKPRTATGRRRLKNMTPQAVCDLHGLTREEARVKLDGFISESASKQFKKVLIVHGKGIHSEDGPVLAREVRAFIEADPRLGIHGQAQGKDGGSGATWAILK